MWDSILENFVHKNDLNVSLLKPLQCYPPVLTVAHIRAARWKGRVLHCASCELAGGGCDKEAAATWAGGPPGFKRYLGVRWWVASILLP